MGIWAVMWYADGARGGSFQVDGSCEGGDEPRAFPMMTWHSRQHLHGWGRSQGGVCCILPGFGC